MRLRLLSFNIHGGFDLRGRRDLQRVHELMDAHDVDIGVFQEFETRASRGGTERDIHTIAGDGRPHHLRALTMMEQHGTYQGWYGNLIVSRYPIVRGLVHDLETTPSREPRNAVDALIETPLGRIRVIGTHLSLSPIERWSEVRNLVRVIDQVEESEVNPMLVVGDINEWRGSSQLLRHLDALLTPIPAGRSFPSLFPLFRLDRAWGQKLPGPAQARCLRGPERYMSDHLPLLVEITGT